MFLRWCGRDGGAEVSLSEAVTAVRVRVECGLLTEAFMYQRMLCMKIKEKQLKHKLPVDTLDDSDGELRNWTDWVLVLVTEICYLCVRRNFTDRFIELPWNYDEERHLRKSLLDCAMGDPCTTAGSLLVVYYLQVNTLPLCLPFCTPIPLAIPVKVVTFPFMGHLICETSIVGIINYMMLFHCFAVWILFAFGKEYCTGCKLEAQGPKFW